MGSLPKGWEKVEDRALRPSGRKIIYRNESLQDDPNRDGGYVAIRMSSSPAVIDAGKAGLWRVKTSMYSEDSTFEKRASAEKRAREIMREMNAGDWKGGLL